MRAFTWYASKLLTSQTLTRSMSQSTSIPKKQIRVRDHGYDNYMEIDKKVRKILKFQELILSQPNNMLSVSRLDSLARRIGFKQLESGRFILKFPHVFEIFEHPVQRILYCRLTRKAVSQIQQENEALLQQIPDAVTRVRKLLMLSNTGRVRLELILSQPNNMLSVSRLDSLARRIGFKQLESGRFILKFPHVFEIFEHPVQRILYCRLTRKAASQIQQENEALLQQKPDAVTRVRKLLMLSNTGRVRLEHIRIARKEFGLPDDFEYSVILKHPQYFRLFDADETRNKYIVVDIFSLPLFRIK
ncbi:hypothetical protein CASFOL_008334 [Castilleja foliolosa]|uniref:PORR domain-containing protein n=1 Tax=Castilleja foliolosa TaxID=1961234 RepID=A0ABD3E2Q2_9LAMI